jgi:lipopolysaccharide/colanic/teichoic acid biosynthesis glycosyltransferase
MSVQWRRLATYEFGKRVVDVVGSAAALVVLSPVLAIVATVVAARLGRPVIFAQERPGLHGRVFTMYKFRTMRDLDERHGLVSDGDRLTSLGRMLRSTSLDELPSLWNVLKGDMSLVGPRPLLVEYLARYTPGQARRHEVRPGITGLAQVHGRNALTWEEKFAYDVEYVDSRSMAGDVGILLATIRGVLAREGIGADGQPTMAKYTGSSRAD